MTRASQSRAVRRIVETARGDFVVEVRHDLLLMRPLRARADGPAAIAVKWESVYLRGFEPRPRRRLRRSVL